MPVLAGRFRRSWVKASNPPAEAPMPTIGKDLAPGASFADDSAGGIVFVLGPAGAGTKGFFTLPGGFCPFDLAITREGLAKFGDDAAAFDLFFPFIALAPLPT
jgi:hypothetical protein